MWHCAYILYTVHTRHMQHPGRSSWAVVHCCGWINSWCCWICLSTAVVGTTAGVVGSVCQLLWLEQQLVLLALLSTAVVGTTAGVVGSVINCCVWNNSWWCWLCCQLLWLKQQLMLLALLSTAVVRNNSSFWLFIILSHNSQCRACSQTISLLLSLNSIFL